MLSDAEYSEPAIPMHSGMWSSLRIHSGPLKPHGLGELGRSGLTARAQVLHISTDPSQSRQHDDAKANLTVGLASPRKAFSDPFIADV